MKYFEYGPIVTTWYVIALVCSTIAVIDMIYDIVSGS